MRTARQLRNEIARLTPKAESGEQWADICALEAQAVELEKNEPVKHFQRFTHEERADRASSHRLGFRQRTQLGTSFWTHPKVPGIAFQTRKAALQAAMT